MRKKNESVRLPAGRQALALTLTLFSAPLTDKKLQPAKWSSYSQMTGYPLSVFYSQANN
jgi:hypothetical protein